MFSNPKNIYETIIMHKFYFYLSSAVGWLDGIFVSEFPEKSNYFGFDFIAFIIKDTIAFSFQPFMAFRMTS